MSLTFQNIRFSTVQTLTGRTLAHVDIILNEQLYEWIIYISLKNGETIEDFLSRNSNFYEKDILRKEQIWINHPKTREVINFAGEIEIENISKTEIVKPTIPDFFELSVQQNILSEQFISIWDDDEKLKKRLSFYETKDLYTDYENDTLENAILRKQKHIKKTANDILGNYCEKLLKDIDKTFNEILALRETRRNDLLNQSNALCEQVSILNTIDEVIYYKIGFDINTILYDTLTNSFLGEARPGYFLTGETSKKYSDTVIELILTEESIPQYDINTQKLNSERIVDIVNLEWRNTYTIENLSESEIARKNWHYIFPKRLIVPKLLLDMYPGIAIQLMIRNLPIVETENSFILYMNEISPEHLEIINANAQYILIENYP